MLDRFRLFSLRHQIFMIAGAIAAFAVIIGAVWFFGFRTTYQPLFSGLRAGDAATIVADLDRKKLSYRLADGGTTILVPADKADSTRLNVVGEDLPLNGTVGFELFNKSDMGLTDFAQKINYQRALQGELERTIMTLDGVDTVRVHLSLSEDRIFRDDRVPPKASVTVRMQKDLGLSESAAAGIRRLVAGAVPKMEAADVVVLDEKGQEVGSTPNQVDGSAETLSPAAEEKRSIEQYYESRVRELLDRVYSRGRIAVAISADLPAIADGSAAGAVSLPDFMPSQRNFRLHVVLSPVTPLDAQSEESVRNIVAVAIGTDAVKDDSIAFSNQRSPLHEATTGDAPVANVDQIMLPPATATPLDNRVWLLALSLPVLLLSSLASIYLIVRQFRGTRRLTRKQHAAFAAKFSAALAEGDVNAALP